MISTNDTPEVTGVGPTASAVARFGDVVERLLSRREPIVT